MFLVLWVFFFSFIVYAFGQRFLLVIFNNDKKSKEIESISLNRLFVDRLWVFCHVFVMPLCASVYLCLVVTCWEMADLLALVCGV